MISIICKKIKVNKLLKFKVKINAGACKIHDMGIFLNK